MNRSHEAMQALDLALKMSHTPEETAAVESMMKTVQRVETEHLTIRQRNTQLEQKAAASASSVAPGITPPRAIHKVQAAYTEQARAAKREGVCTVVMIIGTDGKPSNITVTKKLGYGLDEHTVAAVQQWRFEPARNKGKPILSRFTVEMTFHSLGDQDKIYDLSDKAQRGDAAAEYELAKDFLEGHDMAKDEAQGVALLERAARGGIPQAQFEMGERTYGDGTNGDNFVDAYVWYVLAKNGGIEQTEMKTNELEQKMTPEQLAEAQKRLAKWTPSTN
jgi:TonB family protein